MCALIIGDMRNSPEAPGRLVVLGGLGDLATRHLMPALAHLQAASLLPPELRIIAVDRAAMNTPDYRDRVAHGLARHASATSETARSLILSRLDYLSADLGDESSLGQLFGASPAVVYLALPPLVYRAAVRALRAARLPDSSRVVIEKPFGKDRQSAHELNSLLHGLVDERHIFRADHFLYHQVVQDMLTVRFSSSAFSGLFDGAHMEAVDLVWEESSGIEGRAEFYDANGALRDMVQSHLLQALTVAAMEPCPSLDSTSFRDRRVELLRHVRAPRLEEMDTHTARGRYTSGVIEGARVRGYAEEEGIDAGRGTETFAIVRFRVDTPRWRGVPFTVRTGKRLGCPQREMSFRLRSSARGPSTDPRPPERLRFSPRGFTVDVPVSAPAGLPGSAFDEATLPRLTRTLPPSALLMQDVLRGDPTFCVRDDEVEECWRIVEPIIERWRTGQPPLLTYPAGSAGPNLTNLAPSPDGALAASQTRPTHQTTGSIPHGDY